MDWVSAPNPASRPEAKDRCRWVSVFYHSGVPGALHLHGSGQQTPCHHSPSGHRFVAPHCLLAQRILSGPPHKYLAGEWLHWLGTTGARLARGTFLPHEPPERRLGSGPLGRFGLRRRAPAPPSRRGVRRGSERACTRFTYILGFGGGRSAWCSAFCSWCCGCEGHSDGSSGGARWHDAVGWARDRPTQLGRPFAFRWAGGPPRGGPNAIRPSRSSAS